MGLHLIEEFCSKEHLNHACKFRERWPYIKLHPILVNKILYVAVLQEISPEDQVVRLHLPLTDCQCSKCPSFLSVASCLNWSFDQYWSTCDHQTNNWWEVSAMHEFTIFFLNKNSPIETSMELLPSSMAWRVKDLFKNYHDHVVVWTNKCFKNMPNISVAYRR